MDKFWWRAVWGLCLVQLSLAQIELNVTCRYAGVFHVEKNGRYSISRTEAADLCKAFNCTLPTMAQMEKALKAGFETCRYGFIEGHVVIPRIHPNSICAANNTGVYILTSNTSQYDTYCFNASAPDVEDCTSITDLPNAFDGPITISIVNRDGSRYVQKGEYRTNPADINSSNYTNSTEDDITSGYSSEKSPSIDYIFHTDLTTAYPTQEKDRPRVSGSPEKTPTTISTTRRVFDYPSPNEDLQQWSPDVLNPEILLQTTARMTDVDRSSTSDYEEGWTQEPHSPLIHHEHPEEEETQHSASTTPATPSSATEETATQKEQWFMNGWHGEYPQTPKEDSHSTAGTAASSHDNHPDQRRTTQSQEDSSWTYSFNPISHPMGRGHQTEKTMDMDSSHSTTLQPSADPNTGLVEDLDRIGPLSITTQQSHTQRLATSHEGLEEDKDHPMTPTPTSSNRNDGGGENLAEDSTASVEGYSPHSPDTNEYRTLIPVTPANTGSPGVSEVTVVGDSVSNVDSSLSGDQDSDPSGKGHTTQGSESAGHSSGSQGGANTTSSPMRKPQIPEWLIILASLLALALILAVCIAVNSRRRCGQKKKLVINNGNGAVEERKPSGLNGEASKSQEMVHLVNKEPSETPDQCMTADETRNLQNVDMKIGV
ncbi:CD44 molecule (Indian blood group) [Rhinolophus ferrumequinum]|uniref:CD44 antigen n=1 Tax=Rhinolophus ferrumequinum TaxID=59479 RepID=A0A7J7W637_RHIFE|nr:CD44 molecule (Indian blood group) [Rhinolophus ferrumequinum]